MPLGFVERFLRICIIATAPCPKSDGMADSAPLRAYGVLFLLLVLKTLLADFPEFRRPAVPRVPQDF